VERIRERLAENLNKSGFLSGEELTKENIRPTWRLISDGSVWTLETKTRGRLLIKFTGGRKHLDAVSFYRQEFVVNDQEYCDYCRTQGNGLHPSLVRTVHVGGDDMVVMECCGEESLEDVTNNSDALARQMIVGKNCEMLMGALGCLHRGGLTHGALNPANLRYDPKSGRVAIANLENIPVKYVSMIKCFCVAPEILTENSYDYDPGKIDVWDLAFTMLGALRGKDKGFLARDFIRMSPGLGAAFRGEDAQARWENFLLGEIESIDPKLFNPELWKQFLLGVLQINPEKRMDAEEACIVANKISSIYLKDQMQPQRVNQNQMNRFWMGQVGSQPQFYYPYVQQMDQLQLNQLRQTNNSMLPANQTTYQQMYQLQLNQLQQTNNSMLPANQTTYQQMYPMGGMGEEGKRREEAKKREEERKRNWKKRNEEADERWKIWLSSEKMMEDMRELAEREKKKEEERKRKDEEREREWQRKANEEKEQRAKIMKEKEEKRFEEQKKIIEESGYEGPIAKISSEHCECQGHPRNVEFSLLADGGAALAEALGATVGSGKVTFTSTATFECNLEGNVCQPVRFWSSANREIDISLEDGSKFSGFVKNSHPINGTITDSTGRLYYSGPFGEDGKPRGQGMMRRMLNSKSASESLFFDGPCQDGRPQGIGTTTALGKNGEEKYSYRCSFSNGIETMPSRLRGRVAAMVHYAHCLARFMGRLFCGNCWHAGKKINDTLGLGQSSDRKVKSI
jgi:serine/threonine protein kinase